MWVCLYNKPEIVWAENNAWPHIHSLLEQIWGQGQTLL
jgi:hypothetical protein